MPVVGKDLPSLIDQLQNVAAQVTDLTTAGRLETLGMKIFKSFYDSLKENKSHWIWVNIK